MARGPDVEMEEETLPSTSLTYDPDQDSQEKRAIRAGYRSLLSKQDEKRANFAELSIADLAKDLEQSNLLYGRVRNPQEATLDSKHLLGQSEMAAQLARAMKHEVGGFDVDDYIARLVTYMGGRKDAAERHAAQSEEEDEDDSDNDGGRMLDWEKIGRRAASYTRRVPVMDFMYGPLSLEQKKRKVTQRVKLTKNEADKQKPQELTEDDIIRSENETTKNVAEILTILTNLGPQKVNLFKFIVNPHNFGQTVENLFYLSFLIRDAKCSWEMEDGEPIIYACDPPTQEDYEDDLKKRQIVMELDQQTWERAIEVFDIKEPMIPTRKPAKTLLGDKWVG